MRDFALRLGFDSSPVTSVELRMFGPELMDYALAVVFLVIVRHLENRTN